MRACIHRRRASYQQLIDISIEASSVSAVYPVARNRMKYGARAMSSPSGLRIRSGPALPTIADGPAARSASAAPWFLHRAAEVRLCYRICLIGWPSIIEEVNVMASYFTNMS